ncbi:hypothetical protein [Parabacteroides sp. Marseille-P3160]|uniref:hypothetical protein n=1 Tax=Parabacteroides sp. Marseille-P3160 TaxID=1917887 RepID=UPI0009BB87C4|nr:hypothetical protein [Parabacteroides sp. Marseille-P3160]
MKKILSENFSKNILFSLLLLSLFNISCIEKKKNYKDEFDRSIDKNMNSCISILVANQYDSIKAREICSCMLETAFLLILRL